MGDQVGQDDLPDEVVAVARRPGPRIGHGLLQPVVELLALFVGQGGTHQGGGLGGQLPPNREGAHRVKVVEVDTVVRGAAALEPLYANHLTAQGWLRPPGAAAATLAEHARPWGAEETGRFRRELARTEQQVCMRGRSRATSAWQWVRDAERAFALAKPLRRTAQALAKPPGVDHPRLSADEHREIFDFDIVPLLGGITAQEQPVVVYVMGQPGAGKSESALLVKRAIRPGAILLVGDEFKVFHPDYFGPLRGDARGAGAAIRADCKAWFAQAEAYVRERRGDVVIEPPRRLRRVPDWRPGLPPGRGPRPAAGAGRTGRRQSPGHRPALRQGAAARQPGAVHLGVGHDRCYQAMAEVVDGAGSPPAVDEVVVVGRDGRAP